MIEDSLLTCEGKGELNLRKAVIKVEFQSVTDKLPDKGRSLTFCNTAALLTIVLLHAIFSIKLKKIHTKRKENVKHGQERKASVEADTKVIQVIGITDR